MPIAITQVLDIFEIKMKGRGVGIIEVQGSKVVSIPRRGVIQGWPWVTRKMIRISVKAFLPRSLVVVVSWARKMKVIRTNLCRIRGWTVHWNEAHWLQSDPSMFMYSFEKEKGRDQEWF